MKPVPFAPQSAVYWLLCLVLFAGVWLLWSGHYNALLLSAGALCCVVVTAIAAKVGFFSVAGYTFRRAGRLSKFWLWLVKEIVLANLDVARIILNPRLPISPRVVTIDARHLSRFGQAFLANSITITPATLSVDVVDGRIEVHCLHEGSAKQLEEGELLRRVAELEGGA